MHIGEVLNHVYDEEVGWRPASGAIKPVHVANGLVRSLTGKQYDAERLHQFLVWWRAGRRADEERSYEALVGRDNEYGSIARSASEFDRMRRILCGLLNADSGLFPSVRNSDMTLTCAQMASRSGNDRGLGEFGAALLRMTPASRLLADAVLAAASSDKPEDPITASVWPFLEQEGRPTTAATKGRDALQRLHNAEMVSTLQIAAADLASHEIVQGNRLRTLERAVQFVCLTPLVQTQALGGGRREKGRTPLLLAMGGGRSDELVVASETSLRLVLEAFEDWLAARLADRIGAGKPLDGDSVIECSSDGRQVRRILRSIARAEAGHGPPDEELVEARMAAFLEARQELGPENAAAVLARTLVSAYLQEYVSGGPREFIRGLSSRVGLVYPHFQGRGTRRLRPAPHILDMLVRACVPAGTSISLDDFLAQLFKRFGLVTGGLRTESWDDLDALYQHGITIDATALEKNTEALVSQLEAMGLARRYADNVTFVGDAHVV